MPGGQRLKKALIMALKVGLAVGLLAWLLAHGKLNPREIGSAIRAYPLWMLLALLCNNATILLTAFRWRILLLAQGIQARRRDCVVMTYIGVFFSTFLPGGTGGDFVKAYYIARDSHKKAEAVTTVFLDRVFGLYCLVGFAAVAILVRLGALWRTTSKPALHGLTEAQLLVVGVLSIFLLSTLGLALLLSTHWRRLTHFLLDRLPGVGPVLKRVYEAVYLYRTQKGILLKFIAYSASAHAIATASLWLVGIALGDPVARGGVRALNYLFLIPLGFVVNGLPITPGGFGAFEWALGMLFATVLLPGEQGQNVGVNLAATGHILFVLTNLIGLLFYLKGKRRVAEAAEGASHDALPEPPHDAPA